jgi:hypothetical protein
MDGSIAGPVEAEEARGFAAMEVLPLCSTATTNVSETDFPLSSSAETTTESVPNAKGREVIRRVSDARSHRMEEESQATR